MQRDGTPSTLLDVPDTANVFFQRGELHVVAFYCKVLRNLRTPHQSSVQLDVRHLHLYRPISNLWFPVMLHHTDHGLRREPSVLEERDQVHSPVRNNN